MALNIRNPLGRRVDVKVGADVASGAFAVRNTIAGIPLLNCLNGNTVTFVVEGLVAMTVSVQGTFNQGSFLYWDRSGSLLSLGAAALDLPIGQIVDSEGSTVYLVRLQPSFPAAAATRGQ
jgi:predicted RecA/RadA family phage recombinase